MTSHSDAVVLGGGRGGVGVRKGSTWRVWHGEDLRGVGEGNNRGEVCVDVFAVFL